MSATTLSRAPRTIVVLTGSGLLIAAACVNASGLLGLRAAGLTGTPPPGAALFSKLIDTLTQNATWLVVTGVGLVLTVVAGLMIYGSQRAPDILFRVVGGIGLILIVIPAVLA